jgi:hypothetical protein
MFWFFLATTPNDMLFLVIFLGMPSLLAFTHHLQKHFLNLCYMSLICAIQSLSDKNNKDERPLQT